MGELSNGGWDLETLVENDFLALETNVFRPLDEASQVCLGTNVLTWKQKCQERSKKITKVSLVTYTEILGVGMEERVLLCLGTLAGTKGSSSGFLT